MKEELWNVYLQLQGEMAYTGPTPCAPIDVDPTVGTSHAGQCVLVIGPSSNEIQGAKRLCAGAEIHVLSLNPSDATFEGLGVSVTIGDMHDMPYPTGRFHGIMAMNVLEHALAPYVALMEYRRVTLTGGWGRFGIPSFVGANDGANTGRGPFHLHCLTEDVWRELLRKTGWEVTKHIKEVGVIDPSAHYEHFEVQAIPPAHPHTEMLRRLIEFKRGAV